MEYLTHKFYNDKGQRLSIGAFKYGEDKLHMAIVTCSKKDAFEKRFARKAIESATFSANGIGNVDGIEIHPTYLDISIEEGKPKMTFLKWCNQNYNKRQEATKTFDVNVIQNKQGKIIEVA